MPNNQTKQFQEKFSKAGIKENTTESRKWFMVRARHLHQNYKLTDGSTSLVDNPLEDLQKRLPRKQTDFVGSMWMFHYSPIGKDRLPYWDTFPLIFGLKKGNNRFTGFNLHYLSPLLRFKLLKIMEPLLENPQGNWGPETKYRLEWDRLKTVTKYLPLRITIKQYLNRRVRSRFLRIEPGEWEKVLFLPTERFQGATRQEVWRASKLRI